VTEDVEAAHGTTGGCTIGRGAKPGGTLRAGVRTDSGGKPNGNTDAGRDADMGGVAAIDVHVLKISKSLVRRGEAEKGKSTSSNAICREKMMRLVDISRH
jgi:hypothetical protein